MIKRTIGGDSILYKKSNYLIVMILALIAMLNACKDPEVERKIDVHLRLHIKSLQESNQLDRSISIVFKSNEELTDLHKEVLQKKGIKIVANIGHIYSATLPAKSLYDLAKMRFVQSIQGSREFQIHPSDSVRKIQKF